MLSSAAPENFSYVHRTHKLYETEGYDEHLGMVLRVPIVINIYMHTHTHKYSNMKSINTHKALHNIITILWELTELNGAHYTVTIEMRFSSTRNINFSGKTTPMILFLTTTSNLAKAILRKHLICKYF